MINSTRFLLAFVVLTLFTFVYVGQSDAQFRRFYQQPYQPRYVPRQPQQFPNQQPFSPQNPYGQRPGFGQQQGFGQQPAQRQPQRQPGQQYNPGQTSKPPVRSIRPSQIVQPEINEDAPEYPRVCSEFEEQRAIIVSISDWKDHHYQIFSDLVEATKGHTPLLVLFNDANQLKSTVNRLSEWGDDIPHVYFLQLPLDTVWLRDFGPRFAQTPDGNEVLDFYYDGQRPKDDAFPKSWAKLAKKSHSQIKWTLQGGNLICNGSGTAIVSTRIFDDNYIAFDTSKVQTPGNPVVERQKLVTDALIKESNLKQLVILEPLQFENTRHCDMFATFLAEDLIVIGQVDARLDPTNAAILNRNAERMKKVMVKGKPMRVERIPMPHREGKVWSSYTNIIVSNDLILMPTFNTDSQRVREQARAVYRRLMPKHAVKTIDMTSMKRLEGGLHCMSLNLPQFVDFPERTFSFSSALDYVYGAKMTLKQRQEIVVDRYLHQFETASKNYRVKAYAIGMDSKIVKLLRSDNLQPIEVKLELLGVRSRDWLNANSKLILKYGPRVEKHLKNRAVAKSNAASSN